VTIRPVCPDQPAILAPHSHDTAVSDALLDLLACSVVVHRLHLAALEAVNDPLQALSPPIPVQQRFGLLEDPVVC
jgi:hypothetical protein